MLKGALSVIKYIFFDLDDTLFDFPLAERMAIGQTLGALGIAYTDGTLLRYSEINRQCWDALERGELSREELAYRRFEILFSELGVSISLERTQRIYEQALGAYHPFLPGALELLEALCKDYELYAVTNGFAVTQEKRIREAELNRYFRGFFISEHVGYSKPDRRFFEEAFAEIDGFEAEKSIVVGDSLQSDILGAKNAGVKSCLYNPKFKKNATDIIPDYEIHELGELVSLLKKL